jgi:hypothetical protein
MLLMMTTIPDKFDQIKNFLLVSTVWAALSDRTISSLGKLAPAPRSKDPFLASRRRTVDWTSTSSMVDYLVLSSTKY